MTRTKFKKIPFDLELAKKITNKEIKGNIVARNGYKARIICFDRKEIDDMFDPPKNMIVLIESKYGSEGVYAFRTDGTFLLAEESTIDLHIEVPKYSDYSNFEPHKWQPCLVRDCEKDEWWLQVCAGKDINGEILFYMYDGDTATRKYCLPLSEVTERLVGTTKSYEELIKELDAESTATTKNEQQ